MEEPIMTDPRHEDGLAGLDLPEVVAARDLAARARGAARAREGAHPRARRPQRRRRRLPMVEVTTDYRFDGPDGEVGLLDLFEGRLQLIVQHVMYGPDWDLPVPQLLRRRRRDRARPPEPPAGADDELRAGVAGALPEAGGLPERMGWRVPWYSSGRRTLQLRLPRHPRRARRPDRVQLPDARGARAGRDRVLRQRDQPIELPGLSCFLRVGDRVFHTYSTYARGAEVGTSNDFLDLTALGRQEPWEEPKGRLTGLGLQAGSPTLPYPDEYPPA
jgi:predicted dithiol-disulfide oxidoreductase (DUF899 family)